MSILKVDTIRPRSGTTITFGESGDTIAAGSGVTTTGFGTIISNAANNRLTTADGSGGLNAEANMTFDGTNLAVNGVASFGDGTAAAPSVANFGDLNTGMFFPAADTIAFSEGGVEAMRIDSSGNVLIGTTTSPTGSKELVLGGDYIEGVVAIGTVTSSHTISLTNGTVQTATLTASTACTFTMPTATAGKSFVLLLKQAASTGNGTATFTGVKFSALGAPTITATAGKMDILTFVADGTNWYGSYTQGYTP